MSIDRPTTNQVIPLVKRLYEIDCAGGPLHCILDDGNLEDCFIDSDLEDVLRQLNGDNRKYQTSTLELCREILLAMKQMTMTQRKKIYSKHYLFYGG